MYIECVKLEMYFRYFPDLQKKKKPLIMILNQQIQHMANCDAVYYSIYVLRLLLYLM